MFNVLRQRGVRDVAYPAEFAGALEAKVRIQLRSGYRDSMPIRRNIQYQRAPVSSAK